MGVIVLSMLLVCVPQDPAGAGSRSGSLGVQLDSRGWPVVQQAPARPGIDSWPTGTDRAAQRGQPAAARGAQVPAAPDTGQPGLAQGSTLAGVFAQVQPPAAFGQLGTVKVWWRLSVYGERGRIGQREVTHLADLRAASRDRLEYDDGRVLGCVDGSVFAERHGRPWPLLAAQGAPELALFALHLRMPWTFADRQQFAEVGAFRADGSDGSMERLLLQRRAKPGVMGPQPEVEAVDRFEVLSPVGGPPAEFVHQLRCSGERRRVQLDDWRSVQGVKMPFRRTYVDGSGRPTTVLEVLRIESIRPLPLGVFRLEAPSVLRR